jgi:peptidoglycan hydrolase-like protein with peptidoglycan-binding domain
MNAFRYFLRVLPAAALIGAAASLAMTGVDAAAQEKKAEPKPAAAAKAMPAKEDGQTVSRRTGWKIQAALNDKMGAKLELDGVLGAKTTEALKQFQQKNGLAATGKPDEATMKKLGVM